MANTEMILGQKVRDLTIDRDKHRDLAMELLDKHVPEYVPPAVSTAITWTSAGLMGGIDGALGPRNTIGPVPISAIGGVVAAAAAMFVSEPNAKESLNAVARGIGAPVAYDIAFRASLAYFHPALIDMLNQTDAAMAAAAASGATKAPAAK